MSSKVSKTIQEVSLRISTGFSVLGPEDERWDGEVYPFFPF